MLTLIEVILIFALGSIAGWFIELIFRSLISQRRLVNPGFLDGPYLPIYGFGTLILYGISSLDVNIYLKILFFIVSATLLELVTGLIFFYYYNVRLWDYSKQFLNYKGMICPLYSLLWGVLGVLFYFSAYPEINHVLDVFRNHLGLLFVLGFFYGVFLVDVFSSLSILYKIKRLVKEFNKNNMTKLRINYKQFKDKVFHDLKRTRKKNFIKKYIFSLNSMVQRDIFDYIEMIVEEKRKKIEKAIKKKRFK